MAVTLKGPDGKLYDFPDERADEARAQGFTPDQGESQTGAIGSAVTGALRGATLGLSDYVLTAKKMVSPDYLRAQQEEHPVASGLGEAAGMVGGAALGGVPAGGASLLGRAAEGGISKILGEAATESLARRLVTKASTKAAGSAVEAAFLSTGQLVSEDTLGQTDLSAEKVLAHLGVAALLGGALGGALGVGETAIGAAARRVGSATEGGGIGGSLEELADESAVKATAARGADLRRLMSKDKLRQVGNDMRNYTLADGRKIIDEGALGMVTKNDTESMLERLSMAKQEAGQRLGAFREQVNAATESDPALQPKVSDFLDQVREKVTDPLLGSRLPAVRAKAQEVGQQLQGLADEAAKHLQDTAAPLSEEAMSRLSPEAYARHLMETGEPLRLPLSQFEDLRKGLADIVYPKVRQGIAPPVPQSVEELRKTERILADFIDQHTERVVQQTQPELAGQYATLRRQYSSLSTAAGLTGKADMMDVGNRWLSPSDYMTAAATAVTGQGGDMVRGLAAGIAHKIIRERGRAVVSVMAGRAAQLAVVERAVGSVSSKVASSIDGFMSGLEGGAEHVAAAAAVPSAVSILRDVSFAPPGVRAAANDASDPGDVFKLRSAELTQAVSNPAALASTIGQAVAPLEPVAPKLAAQLTMKAVATTQFLASKLPRNPGQPGLLLGSDRWRPSDAQLATFARYVRAAQQPLSILDDLKRGTVSSEAVETIKALYPQLYGEIGTQLSRRVAELRTTVPYPQRARLAQLFGTPIDATTRPEFVADLQHTFALLDSQPGGRGGGGAGGLGGSLAQNLQTPVDRIMSQ